jgi:rare lipoprotein A
LITDQPMSSAWGRAAVVVFITSAAVQSRAEAPASTERDVEVGLASYYARSLDGRRTASGTRFDNDALVAAHPTHPFGTLVRVTNVRNRRSVTVRVVDRGPARSARRNGVIIDLSRAAAGKLGFLTAGLARVRVEVVDRPRGGALQRIDEAPDQALDSRPFLELLRQRRRPLDDEAGGECVLRIA